MNTNRAEQHTKAKRLADVYNMLPNLLWSVLGLGPITVFCYTQLDVTLFFLFIGISLLPAFLSHSFIDKMQVSKRTAFYKKLRVDLVQRLSQNGEMVNNRTRRKYPAYKVVWRDQTKIKGLFRQTYVFEKFHLILFIFFLLTFFYALSKGMVSWSAVIFLLNIFYNLYPILLQQLIRMKLTLFIRKNTADMLAAKPKYSNLSLKCMN